MTSSCHHLAHKLRDFFFGEGACGREFPHEFNDFHYVFARRRKREHIALHLEFGKFVRNRGAVHVSRAAREHRFDERVKQAVTAHGVKVGVIKVRHDRNRTAAGLFG